MAGTNSCIDLEDIFMGIAVLVSKRSEDPNTQVGACIVNEDNKIVSVGYNGMPNGCENAFDWENKVRTSVDCKHWYVCHAELNAINLCNNSSDLKNSKIYSTLFPCNECAKLIIQSGIKDVIYLSNKYAKKIEFITSAKMLKAAGINPRPFEAKNKIIELQLTE